MTAPVFVEFLDRKLAENDVRKVVPDRDILERHARRVIERDLAKKVLEEHGAEFQAQAASAILPGDLADLVRGLTREKPELPWDLAVAAVVANGVA
jgi:hypothetical protein